LITLSACSESEGPQRVSDDPDSFIITDVRLFDGFDVHANKTVTVVDGLIESIDDEHPAARNLRRIDGNDKTLMPGLIDAHTHTQTAEQLHETLRWGVTTVFDMATAKDTAAILRKDAEARNDIAGFFSSVQVATVPDGHGTQYGRPVPTLTEPEEAAGFVAARFAEGSDYLKILRAGARAREGWPTLDADTVFALSAAAHARDEMVVIHVETLDDVRIAADAGAEVLAHVWRDAGADAELSAMLAERGIVVATTLVTQDAFIDAEGGSTLVADPRLKPWLSKNAIKKLTTRHGGPVFDNIDRFIEAASGLIEAGVTILAGTDVSAGTTSHGISMHRELELLVRAGLSPLESLKAATSNVSATFGVTDRGVIAPGRRADLLLVKGDPTVDVLATRDIVGVWRGGIKFERELRPEER
jgi:imidazolonepropionase-like amidohydrolase